MHSKRITRPRRKNWWLLRKFGKDGWLKLAEAATVEDIRATRRRLYHGWPTKIVQAQ